MKKLISTLVAFVFLCSVAYAQNKDEKKLKPASKASTQKATSNRTPAHKNEAMTAQKTETKTTTTKAEGRTVKTKKDGTPDMRYKENKETAKTSKTVKTKKDGTPDMRYKENKEAAKKK